MINFTSVLKPDTYQAFGSSPVMHILPHEDSMDNVYNALYNLSRNKNFTVYKKEEMDPSWYYSDNRRIMPIVLVAELGYVFDDFQNNIDFYNKKYGFTRKS